MGTQQQQEEERNKNGRLETTNTARGRLDHRRDDRGEEAVHNKFNCWLTTLGLHGGLLFPWFDLAKSRWTTSSAKKISGPDRREIMDHDGGFTVSVNWPDGENGSIRFSWNPNYFSSNFMSPHQSDWGRTLLRSDSSWDIRRGQWSV